MRYFRVIAGKAPNILSGRGMLAKGFEIHLEPHKYEKHAKLVRIMESKPQQWQEFHKSEDDPVEITKELEPVEEFFPHQLEAIRSIQNTPIGESSHA